MNIRQKVITAFTFLVVVTGSIGAVSFHHLREIERKQHFVQIADDLSNYILEARRYEKNYLLYNSEEDLAENRKYIQRGMELLEKISRDVTDLKGLPLMEDVRGRLSDYGTVMEQFAREARMVASNDSSLQEQLRERGKALVEASQEVVSFERMRILDIVKTLKTQLLIGIGMTIVIGGLLVPITYRKIIRPLRIIEGTTHRIARGDFRPLQVLNTRDETQRVVEAFNRMISELERRQEQLLQAKKLSSLGTLTSGIAHELNNPLNNISTSCQILLEEFGDMDAGFSKKMLANIEQEVHRARDIVRGLLEFSRMKEFCLAPVLLSEVVDRSVALISSHIPPGVELIKEVPEGLVLNLDAQRMQQVFLNLIENAIHAIDPPGQIRISALLEPSGDQVIIRVEDTGTGIPESARGSVFDPFFTTKEVGSGTGLGLSIVFGIIQKHQGSIAVESKDGEGARFVIGLPVESKR
jgi:signal transduction histidine kinase